MSNCDAMLEREFDVDQGGSLLTCSLLSLVAMDETLMVAPVCMTFEDYYAAFTKDSHPSLSVSPAVGRMDRRGGEPTELTITCDPRGQAGTFSGDLVINLPEDNSKICYKVNVVSQ